MPMNIVILAVAILAVTLLMTGALSLVGYVFGRRAGFQASDEQAALLREESSQLESKLIETLSNIDAFASKTQVKHLLEQCGVFQKAVEEQQLALASLAERVDKTRVDVQAREQEQQELRALREDDEAAINQALAKYSEFSAESLSLEQKLAESLRTLDAMASEIKMTSDQQAVFTELSNALTQASAQLRDVIVDYQNANERLVNLNSRFVDLENEYSKLVEQQLAG